MNSVIKFLYGVEISNVEISRFIHVVRRRQVISLLAYLFTGVCFVYGNLFCQMSLVVNILAGVAVFATLLISVVYAIYGFDVITGVSREVLVEPFFKRLIRRVGLLVCFVPFYFLSDLLYVNGGIALNVFTIFLMMSFIIMYSLTIIRGEQLQKGAYYEIIIKVWYDYTTY